MHGRPLRRPHRRAQFILPPRAHPPPPDRPEQPAVIPVAQPGASHTPQPMHIMGDALGERIPHVHPADMITKEIDVFQVVIFQAVPIVSPQQTGL